MQKCNRRAGKPASVVVVATAIALGCISCTLRPQSFVPGFTFQRGSHRATNAPVQFLQRSRVLRSASSVSVPAEIDPLSNHVLVKIKGASDVSKGGILLTTKDKPKEGKVVAVGTGKAKEDTGVLVPVSVEPGSSVIYARFGGVDLDCDGVEHSLVRDDDILLSYSGDEPTLENAKMPRGRVLVRLLKAEGQSEGGLLLSKGASEDVTDIGEVMLVGEGEVLKDGSIKPAEVAEGDMVTFRFGDQVKLDIGDAKFSSVKASNCIAKWKAA